jgi:hypothetical protein
MEEQGDPFASLPANFKDAIMKMINDTVEAKVKEQVAQKMEAI